MIDYGNSLNTLSNILIINIDNKKFITSASNIKPKVSEVKENDIIVKMHLWDGDFTAKEALDKRMPSTKSLYSNRVNFYGCYAGHLILATDGELTIGSGHDLERDILVGKGLEYIEDDAKKILLNFPIA